MDTLKIEDNSAAIKASFQPILREPLSIRNMEDKSYFDYAQYQEAKATERNVTSKYYQKEALFIAQINKIVKEGRALMYTLYAFRSCGKAIPQVQSQSQENKQLLYGKTCEVLRPGIYRMIDLMTFQDKLNACFTEVMAGIIPDIKDRDLFPSDIFLLALASLLDLTISLDTMKNFKGSMSNDLSMYKRSKSMISKDCADPEIQILPKLGFFLASKDQFANGLKTQLASINNYYEDVLCDMINLCLEKIEANVFLKPAAKHMYLRAMAFAIILIDGETEDMDFNKKKKFKVDKVGKIFKSSSVVPLFGDIAISLGSILVKAPHWNQTKFDLNRNEPETVAELQKTYLLMNHANEDFLRYQYLMTCLKKTEWALFQQPVESVNIESCSACYSIVHSSINFLSGITNKVLEQAAWKYLNPNQSHNSNQDSNANYNQAVTLTAVYEQAVQYNYSPDEKATLIKYISMIKNLSSYLQSIAHKTQPYLNRYIYCYIQDFSKSQLNEYMAYAQKKKRPITTQLKNVKEALSDGEGAVKPFREDPISNTQLYFARSMLDYMFSEKSKNMKGGLMKEKNFKDAHINELQKFYGDTFFFTSMMELNETIREASDLSNLWFKEFYLELTKQVQFRISTSLPWILAEFALDTQNSEILQDVFFPLDLYNEAAYKTLYCLQSRYIFNEIEAEVNLCFDQFMFKLGKNMFAHYKKLAAIRLLPSDNKLGMMKEKDVSLLGGLEPDAFESILSQKSIRLLGRNVNINKILSQIMNQYIRHSIDVAISRYEASDITYVLELESLLENCKMTHKLLSLHLELENFDDLVKEIDECTVPGENNGRIVTHSIEEIIKDVVSNFRYNAVTSRFLRGDVFYADPLQRPKFPNARVMYLYGTKALSVEYALKHGLFKDYVGMTHLSSLFQIVGQSGFAVLIAELLAHIALIIDHTLEKFLNTILELTPQSIHFPLECDSLPTLFNFLEKRQEKLISCKFLKSEILQAFRELGNAISVIRLIENILILHTSKEKILVNDIVSYDDDIPCFVSKLSSIPELLNNDDKTFSFVEWVETIKKVVREPTSKSLIMKKTLYSITKSLGDVSQFIEGDNIPQDRTFAKAWASLSFAACMPQVGGEKRIRELFGDGLAVAGATLLFCFGQYSIFPVLDINYHLWTKSKTESEMKNPGNQKPEIKTYLSNAQWFVQNTEAVCAFLRTIRK